MAQTTPAKKAAQPSPKRARAKGESSATFTAEERAAMKEYAAERKSQARGVSKEDGEREVLAKIAEMPAPDRKLAQRFHEIVRAAAPDLVPRTWYGMPAYAQDGKIICFFQNASKFKARYATFGFSDKANLDDGAVWPTGFALTEFTPAVEKKVTALVKKAIG